MQYSKESCLYSVCVLVVYIYYFFNSLAEFHHGKILEAVDTTINTFANAMLDVHVHYAVSGSLAPYLRSVHTQLRSIW